MPSDRAMMAVCEVLPPMSVAKPSTSFLSSCAVVDGLKSWLDQNARLGELRRSNSSFTSSRLSSTRDGQVAHVGGAFAQIFVLHARQRGGVALGDGVKGEIGVDLLLADQCG